MRITGAALALGALGLVELALARRDVGPDGDSVLDRLGRVAVDTVPLPVVEETVRLLGTTDKPLLRGGLAAGIAGAAGLALDALVDREAPPWVGALGAAVGVGGLVAARQALAARREAATAARPPLPRPRDAAPLATDGAEDWPGVEPLYTSPGRFYVTDVNLRPPLVDLARWRLAVVGPDLHVTRLSWDDLVAMPLRERDAILACVHNRLGWDRLGHQRWTGLSLADVLVAGGLVLPDDPATADVVMTAVDGYQQVLPLDVALEADSWVVLGMGGEALPVAHGFPARVMTPGVVGQYNGVKWLQELRLAPRGTVDATWVARGWPRETVWIRPMARIDHPSDTGMPPRLPRRVHVDAGRTSVVGTAWHPPLGVARVDVRVDDGAWQAAELADEVTPASWRRWRLDVDLAPGRHVLAARCVGADGTVQEAEPSPPFPDGTTGHHEVTVHAR